MLNSKTLPVCLLLIAGIQGIASADTLSELELPKPPAYRVGISEFPETQYRQAQQDKGSSENKLSKKANSGDSEFTDLTYADLSIKKLSKEVSQDLEFDENDMLADLSLLWQGAAVQSDTINFALYKLANPDADKPDEKSIKKVLSAIAGMSTLVGASVGSPILAGSSLIGGNILGIMSQDTKALNYKYTRVTDADMIVLIRKVEDLQQKTIDLYYDYMGAKKQLEFVNDLVADRKEKFETAQKNNAPRELIVITDAYYRTSLDKQRNVKADFFSKRAALEQFVGNETFIRFEEELVAREKGETRTAENLTPETEEDYNNTVKSVENYITDNAAQNGYFNGFGEESGMLAAAENPEAGNDEVLTGSSSNISGEKDSVKNSKKEKKVKKEKTQKADKKKNKDKKENSEAVKNKVTPEQPRKKYPKNSTKDLIFLHGQDKSSANSLRNPSSTEVNTVPVEQNTGGYVPEVQPHGNYGVNTQNVSPSEFLPLDEIKIPELRKDGYSIHSYQYGEY